ncbi:hypothetical protein TWF225_005532 [Orbilia oligospora]|nr:hypothetical protein TWF225_005532 [Orbilia oligospora]KAF3259835.1 hypothetical protein TWF128_003829 [Orbilia oligospora]KAF3270855.1 hypothetical protein TWF217_007130 [Orbilia oligospora]KAF3292339.1 hypothetical protein TWF132_005730 [Orbilia oligospora]
MGLFQQPLRSTYHDLPTPPPSTPFSLPPLQPLASTVNIHITNHNHYSVQTPDSAKYNFGPKDKPHWSSSGRKACNTPSRKSQHKSPLLKRLIQGLSPVYGLLTPAATPPQRTSKVTLVEEQSPLVKQNSQAQQKINDKRQVENINTSYRHSESDILQDMPNPADIRFSASAGNREFAVRSSQLDIPSSPLTLLSCDDVLVSEDSALGELAVALRTSKKTGLKRSEQKKRTQKQKQKNIIPACYNHDLRLPGEEPGVDVVPCDWVRPYNSSRWNNYTNKNAQCKVPKCDVCISHETYGPKSIWALSAPAGFSAESHRLRSRIRYLCSRCPQPAPLPPGGVGPIEMCTCVLRDGQGLPTDMWFQCKGCAETAWFESDARYGGPDGVLIKRRPRRRKNKYGIIIRPRISKDARLKGGCRIKRCLCGKIVPKDGRYGAWCTWCQCPVAGKDMMEYGGAATKSGRAFLPKKENEDEDEDEGNEDELVAGPTEQEDEIMDDAKKDRDEDEEMAEDTDDDSGIDVFE